MLCLTPAGSVIHLRRVPGTIRTDVDDKFINTMPCWDAWFAHCPFEFFEYGLDLFLDILYGIVTNYIQWTLLQIGSEKTELDVCSLRLQSDGPHL